MMIRAGTHKARKQYTCAGCLGPIEQGEEYVRQAYNAGGIILDECIHWHCAYAEALAGVEDWRNAFSGEKFRAISFSEAEKAKVAAASQDVFIKILGAG